MSADLQPDVDEVLQTEAEDDKPYIPPLCVKEVQAPVRVQTLPRKGGGTLTKPLTTSPVQVLTADHRRGRALLVSSTAFLVAFSEASCQADSAMAAWPANVPLELSTTAEVWAKVDAGTADLAVVIERWALGE